MYNSFQAIKFSPNFKSMQRYFEIDVKLSDGSDSKKLLFDRIGTVADLVREIRRELNIAPEEKVYFTSLPISIKRSLIVFLHRSRIDLF